ncbi:DUF2235 domain-containing protein [Bradyrhizobium sp. CB3481]|uniref:T6SS phospholipase effector Tle1-like catalytic domain-containing protein n=1 Tax=Bradyrhizobium sp. CB3481 TaxID=3039158 RepID=UPI0024B03DBA|nr:DUF2235 domain-containing protein [Bradyrhizobium sp. CB3481]WFU16217.1 DUF2235 domain-containing protein [Bradyrhizobium sp. CB3481]
MSKRIILLSDGTGNSASKVWKSNVWRVFESLDLRANDQVAFYDDGVGTSSFKPLAILGGVFGWGLKRNVLDIYRFLCANYEPGDQIFGFGFSRGAFTMRVVVGLVLNQGLVTGATKAELYEQAAMAYRAYRAERFHTFLRFEWPFRKLRDAALYLLGKRYNNTRNRPVERIDFIGVWDTVAAYGLPIDEMARGVSQYIWPLELPNRNFDTRIQRACHALSLDDERTTFHPVLWNEQGVPRDRLSQVWFAGVHSNVGGGYPDDSLAYIPLYWIMKEAQALGLQFKTIPNQPTNPDPDMMAYAEWRRDKDGRLYDSRNGLGGYYRYGPRRIADLSHMRFSWREGDRVNNNAPTIHETAIVRAQKGAHRYAPIGIPQHYDLLTDTGIQPQANLESQAQAAARCDMQEQIWNDVWRRRLIYFITVFASLYLAIYPLSRIIPRSGEFTSPLSLVSGAIRALGHVLPGGLALWIDAYARDPSHFLVLGFFVVLLIWLGVRLGKRIEDRMERVWRSAPAAAPSKLGIAYGILSLALIVYFLGHAHLPAWLRPPRSVAQFLAAHMSFSVATIMIATWLALFTPSNLVHHLRTWRPYRTAVRSLKLIILPFVFAASFLTLAVLFGSHLVFSIEEAGGRICRQSDNITAAMARGRVANQGLDACISPGIASCSKPGEPPKCSNGRDVFCGEGQPVCEPMRKAGCDDTRASCRYDMPVCRASASPEPGKPPSTRIASVATCPFTCEIGPVGEKLRQLDISEVCHATGIWLEQGQKYSIMVTPPDPKDREHAWRDGDGTIVSTRGRLNPGFIAKLKEAIKWPLKRHLFVEPFKVIARVGSIGSDERVLEPDDDTRTNRLDVQIIPKSSGELFLYVNEAVLVWPGKRNYFHQDNSGKATISVQRARQPN